MQHTKILNLTFKNIGTLTYLLERELDTANRDMHYQPTELDRQEQQEYIQYLRNLIREINTY